MPRLIIALLIIFGAVELYTPLTHPEIAQRWFSLPNLYYFSPSANFSLTVCWLDSIGVQKAA